MFILADQGEAGKKLYARTSSTLNCCTAWCVIFVAILSYALRIPLSSTEPFSEHHELTGTNNCGFFD